MIYTSGVIPCSYGAHPCPSGNLFVFKPWFFDGKIVHWGPPQETESSALAIAERIKEEYS
tara:strand:- start:217 stop:396 length:180 start_codon:yes stop_codon:yes gene_type:complete